MYEIDELTAEPPTDGGPIATNAGWETQGTYAAAEAVAQCVQRLRHAVSADPGLPSRLALADTTVELRARGTSMVGFAAVLRPERVEFMTEPTGDAEVGVVMDATELTAFCSGRLSLQIAILSGAANYRGPVRKLLRVLPIVRHVLGDDSHDGAPVQDWTPRFLEATLGDFWAVECRGVQKRFGHHHVLKGVDLGIPEGMITVILGPSGTGKSVLLKHMIGLLFPESGDVVVHGRSLSNMTLSEMLHLRRRFGIVFQDGALFGSMNLYDNVAFPLRQHTDLSEAEITEIVSERLADVGLAGQERRRPSELSGGMRKRAGLARALVFQPEVVLCDEPDSGLDPVRTALLSELIAKVHRHHGGTFVVISHDVRLAKRLGDYLAILWEGRIVEAGPRDAVLASSNPFVRQFLAGDAEGPLGME